MPLGDRTGPWGLGPMTGRGLGHCAGFPYPGYMNPGYPGLGLGRGFGFGRGYGRGFGFGRGRGRGWRSAGFFPGMYYYPWSAPLGMNYPPYPPYLPTSSQPQPGPEAESGK